MTREDQLSSGSVRTWTLSDAQTRRCHQELSAAGGRDPVRVRRGGEVRQFQESGTGVLISANGAASSQPGAPPQDFGFREDASAVSAIHPAA